MGSLMASEWNEHSLFILVYRDDTYLAHTAAAIFEVIKVNSLSMAIRTYKYYWLNTREPKISAIRISTGQRVQLQSAEMWSIFRSSFEDILAVPLNASNNAEALVCAKWIRKCIKLMVSSWFSVPRKKQCTGLIYMPFFSAPPGATCDASQNVEV